jgi:hypothetical protein
MKTKFPSIRAVRSALAHEWRSLRRLCSKFETFDGDEQFAGTDVRLQVHGENWYIHTGSADYDTNHRGYWGASPLPWGRANLAGLARELVEQAKDMHADEQSARRWEAQQRETRALKSAGLHLSQTK